MLKAKWAIIRKVSLWYLGKMPTLAKSPNSSSGNKKSRIFDLKSAKMLTLAFLPILKISIKFTLYF